MPHFILGRLFLVAVFTLSSSMHSLYFTWLSGETTLGSQFKRAPIPHWWHKFPSWSEREGSHSLRSVQVSSWCTGRYLRCSDLNGNVALFALSYVFNVMSISSPVVVNSNGRTHIVPCQFKFAVCLSNGSFRKTHNTGDDIFSDKAIL